MWIGLAEEIESMFGVLAVPMFGDGVLPNGFHEAKRETTEGVDEEKAEKLRARWRAKAKRRRERNAEHMRELDRAYKRRKRERLAAEKEAA